jgi:hypothetical protein
MDQSKKNANAVDQFMYLGRWTNKAHFRAFVYNIEGGQQLAGSYPEFEKMIASGLWFAAKPEPKPEKVAEKGKRNGPVRANS